uniref:Costars domain-containing protein n=1 Tax=Globodera rostochiensis TaxID=31243 RepID=A0A914GWA6_GLORO
MLWPQKLLQRKIAAINLAIKPTVPRGSISPIGTASATRPHSHDPGLKSVDQTVAKFNTSAQQTAHDAKIEHGSRQYAGAPKFDKKAENYGRPLVGTKSQARGVRGGEHVMREVIFLCEMIEQNGDGTPPDCYIKFGPLFYMYSRISETLVGMLIRARKYGLLDFEGEMLYQRQDDHKKIRLLMSSEEICRCVEYTGDPGNIIKFNNGNMVPPPVARAQLAPGAPPPPVFSLGPKQLGKSPEGTTIKPPPAVPKKPSATTSGQTSPRAVPDKMPEAALNKTCSSTTPTATPQATTNKALEGQNNKTPSSGTATTKAVPPKKRENDI